MARGMQASNIDSAEILRSKALKLLATIGTYIPFRTAGELFVLTHVSISLIPITLR